MSHRFVGDHQQARVARVERHHLERPPAVAPERLEERDLRLDGDDVRRHRVDDPLAETLHRARGRRATGRGLAAQLDRQEVDDEVEPDDELRPLPLDRISETIGERCGAPAASPSRGQG